MIAIGAGRVGTSLATRCAALGRPFTLIDRSTGWEALETEPGRPVLLLVGTGDLDAASARVPPHRRGDLVLVQNGMIRSYVADLGLQRCTRGILYLAAATRGGSILAGDRTVLSGPHAEEVERWFRSIDLPARTVDWLRLTWYELEKTIWLAAWNLVGAVHGKVVGRVVPEHGDALRALVTELLAVGRASTGVEAPLDFVLDRLTRYTAAIPDWPAGVRDFAFRNGWFVAESRRLGVPTPVHDALLARLP
ncbi:MAG: hypothetical protein H0V89_08430 [Deltaproteobacteria bacterium]|nr:hypothetical protein [Deltaproteobacteria bacterium]